MKTPENKPVLYLVASTIVYGDPYVLVVKNVPSNLNREDVNRAQRLMCEQIKRQYVLFERFGNKHIIDVCDWTIMDFANPTHHGFPQTIVNWS